MAIKAAVEKAMKEMVSQPTTGEEQALNRTETQEEVLADSLLKFIDENNSTENDILEAYCRDIDAYSFEFQDDIDPKQAHDREPISKQSSLVSSPYF